MGQISKDYNHAIKNDFNIGYYIVFLLFVFTLKSLRPSLITCSHARDIAS